MTRKAKDVFLKTALDPVAYNHGLDTWFEKTHIQYNEAVAELLGKSREYKGHALRAEEAKEFIDILTSGKKPHYCMRNMKEAWGIVKTWREGFIQSVAVSNGIKAGVADLNLTAAEIKAVTRAVVNGEEDVSGLSWWSARKANKALHTWRTAKGATRLSWVRAGLKASRLMGVLSAMIVMLDANRGYCGEGHRGGALKGVKGGLDEVAFNAMLGYMVEGHVFPLIGNGVDFIGDYFGVNPRKIYFRNGAVFDKSGNLIDGK